MVKKISHIIISDQAIDAINKIITFIRQNLSKLNF